MDRIDIHIQVPTLKYLKSKTKRQGKAGRVRKRVNQARKIQQERYKRWNLLQCILKGAMVREFCRGSVKGKRCEMHGKQQAQDRRRYPYTGHGNSKYPIKTRCRSNYSAADRTVGLVRGERLNKEIEFGLC